MKQFALILIAPAALAQAPFTKQYLKVEPFSQKENAALGAKFKGMRATDVVDGLGVVGLQDVKLAPIRHSPGEIQSAASMN